MVLVLAGHRGILVRWLPLIVYREIKSFQSEVAVCDEHLPPRHHYIKGLLWKLKSLHTDTVHHALQAC